jgi:hypothetical protein
MATRSFVGIQWKSKEIYSTYIQFDGQIFDGVGEMLLTHYNNQIKAQEILVLGDRESLSADPIHDTFYKPGTPSNRRAKDWDDMKKNVGQMVDWIYLWDEISQKWLVSENCGALLDLEMEYNQ